MAKNSNRNKSFLSVKLDSYGTAKVYKSNHIKVDANLLSSLCIRPGDRVEVLLDTEERAIVIKSPEEHERSRNN